MASSNIDALPYYDKQVDDPGESDVRASATYLCVAFKSAAQALIESELRSTPQVSEDDSRLPPNVEVFPVGLVRKDLWADNRNPQDCRSCLLDTLEHLFAG